MFIPFNPNPRENLTTDCTVRAISLATGKDWDTTYVALCFWGFILKDMPSRNKVWDAYLRHLGFRRRLIPDRCPDCYTVKEFVEDYPLEAGIIAVGDHVVAVVNGNYFDSWDSGDEIPRYFYSR